MPYNFARNGEEYKGPYSFLEALSLVNQKAGQWGGRYRVKPSRTEPWGGEMGRPAALLAVQKAMRKAAWGGLVKIEMGLGKPTTAVFLVKKVIPPAKPDPLKFYTGKEVDLSLGNERIQAVATFAKDRHPRVMCSGYVYTRNVAGTSVWSQHSNWATGGNAIDLTVYVGDDPSKGADMDATIQVADTIVAAARAGRLQVHRVIVGDEQYVYPAFSPTSYGGQYHTHVHVEARPLQSGTPVDAP